jgi:hypothetical protein
MAKRQAAAGSFPFVEPATAQFLDEALRKKVDFVRLLRNPRATAEQAGLTLSPAVLKNLKALNRGVAPGKADPADEEILAFFKHGGHRRLLHPRVSDLAEPGGQEA